MQSKSTGTKSLLLNGGSALFRRPSLLFAAWVALCGMVFLKPLIALAQYSLSNDSASHILLVPFIVAGLLYVDRRKLPPSCLASLTAAFPFALAGALLGCFSLWKPGPAAISPPLIASFLLFVISGFVGIFGRRSSRAVWFDLAFLAFAIPWPEWLLNAAIYELQKGSAIVAGWIFDLTGVAALREGFVFHLTGWNVEVAQECSGIRSSMALLILAVLVAHFSFKRFWKKCVFVAAGLLMMMVKNGVRIAVLTILAKYVDRDFLFGKLHHDGGVLFFLLGLALLVPVYWLLRLKDPLTAAPNHREATV